MDKKLIIINKDNQKLMTFEETLEQYHDLVHKMAISWSRRYELDDMKQIAMIGLWRAYKAYDSSKGVAFITVAYPYMGNGLRQYNIKHRPKFDNKTSNVSTVVSLNVVSKNQKGEEGDQLAEMVSSKESLADQVINRMFIREITSHIPDEIKRDIEKNFAGYSIKEIAAERGYSGTWVGKRINKSFLMLKERYGKEMVGV